VSFLFPSPTITLEAALRDAANTAARVRLRAVQALGDVEELAERRRAVAALAIAVEDQDAAVRAAAVSSLGQMGELAPIAALVARLDDGEPAVRQQAAIALGTVRDRAGFAPLLEALRNGPADLRFQAVTSLAEIDPVAAYEPLVEALADRDAQVVAAAAVALGSLGEGRAVLHLVALLGHAEAPVRFEAAWALAELGDARGSAELITQLGVPTADPPEPAAKDARRRAAAPPAVHPGRAIEAVEALARLGSAEERRALYRYLGAASAPPEAVIVAARHVLELCAAGGPAAGASAAERAAAERVLLAALTVRKDHLRGLAVEQLAVVGGAWAVPALEKLGASRRGRMFAEPIAEALAAIAARAASSSTPSSPSAA
jgi:HEAT repeats/PBS lyase HEAT-like repeat